MPSLGGPAELGDAGSLWQALCECEAVAAAAGATEPKRSRIDTPAPASAGHAQRQRPHRPPRPPKATPGQIPASARRDATAQRVTMAHRAHLRRAAANAGPNSSCVRRPSSRAASTRCHRAVPSTRRHRAARHRRATTRRLNRPPPPPPRPPPLAHDPAVLKTLPRTGKRGAPQAFPHLLFMMLEREEGAWPASQALSRADGVPVR